jgi:hypothetical protein
MVQDESPARKGGELGSTRERENGAVRTGGGAHGRMRDVYADVRAGMVRKIDAAGAAVSAAQVETVVFRADVALQHALERLWRTGSPWV